jgi:hypothetical protein
MNLIGTQFIASNEIESKKQVKDSAVHFLQGNLLHVESLDDGGPVAGYSNSSATACSADYVIHQAGVQPDTLEHLLR